MPYTNDFVVDYCGNRLVYAELDYNKDDELHVFESNFNRMTGLCSFLHALFMKTLKYNLINSDQLQKSKDIFFNRL